jgi:hypothetical protein
MNKLHQEIKTILRKGNENKGNSFILTSLFLIILINNFLGFYIYYYRKNTEYYYRKNTDTCILISTAKRKLTQEII